MIIAQRILLVIIVLMVSVPYSTQPASACSCAPSTPEEMLDRSEAAFIGKVVSKVIPSREGNWSSIDPVSYTFEIELVAKGHLSDYEVVHSVRSGASCGFEGVVPSGGRTGILLRTDNAGNYTSGLCSTISPDDLLTVSTLVAPQPNVLHGWLPVFVRSLRHAFTELLLDLHLISESRIIGSAR